MSTLPESKLYIDGVIRGATGERTYDVIGPWTGEVVSKAADASREDIEAAIVAARRAFDTTDWSTSHSYRLELTRKFRDLLLAKRERLIAIARHEHGAALGAMGPQVDMAIAGLTEYINIFPSIQWEEDRGPRQTFGFTTQRVVVYEAAGVVAAITPWNVPLYVNLGKLGAAFLAGCTVILKGAPNTPSMNYILGEIAQEAGFPAGVLNVITASDPVTAGEMLVTDPRVDLVSFTGSTAVGRHIMQKGGLTLKRLFLELGGKSCWIVLEDTPDFATMCARSMVINHAGQGCAITTRLLVPQSRYDEAVGALKNAYAALGDRWGGFDEPTHQMGPVVSKKQLERVLSYIEIGKKEGATLLAGGRARPDKGSGFFVEPTCFINVTNDMRIAQEEIFGPVLSVIAFNDDEDAIRIANDSIYGLSGLVFSGDTERALRMAKRIRTGTIGVNGGLCITGDLPFGGYKHSGIGREWGREGIEEMRETKAIGIRR